MWRHGVGLLVRFVSALLLSGLLFLWMMTPTPTPRWAWPLLDVLFFPLQVAVWLIGSWPLGDYLPVSWIIVEFMIVGSVTYTLVSYALPPGLRVLRRASVALAQRTRASLRDPLSFATYLSCGAILGAMIGAAIWAYWRYVDSLVAWSASAAILAGWVTAIARSSASRGRVVLP
jgi:hypothetical protein